MNTKNEELIKDLVPEIILSKATQSKFFGETIQDQIENFDGDTFDEYTYSGIEYKEFFLKQVESFGGYEGAGDTMWSIYSLKNSITNEEVFFRLNGYYSSWDDNMWNGFDVVKPVEVTVTKWDAV